MALILTLSWSWSIPNPPGMPSLARFARHLRLFTIPDKDHTPNPNPNPKPHPLANPQCKHHSFGGSLSLDPLSHSQIQRQGCSPASFPIKRKDATPTRDTNRRILSPYPLSLKRGNSQIAKTVLSTATPPHQP